MSDATNPDCIANEEVHTIQSRQDLARFLLRLSRDCQEDADSWQHDKVECYLEAIATWLQESQADPTGQDCENEWQTVAKCFLVGKYYE